MTLIGTPLTANAKRIMLLGSGELGKELAIELQRLGCEIIAVDRYANAPAMHVAHRSHVINMLDGVALRRVVELEKPHLIVPEIEAIATDTLIALEQEGYTVIPTARAARLTMNREGIRRLAAEKLKLPTSPYHFANNYADFTVSINAIGLPCVVKPIMSSSGKGQSIIKTKNDIQSAWDYAQAGGRAGQGTVIIEGFIEFDYEITLLTIRTTTGTQFCAPIGHAQIAGDYRESWQPQAMPASALGAAEDIAKKITDALGGYGLFGVELFIKGDKAIFSEVSPRPHDTGMVTLISQDLSEFALHARAILGLPIPSIRQRGAAASCALLAEGDSNNVVFENLDVALAEADTRLHLFGKPTVQGKRRMGVALALADTIEAARAKAIRCASAVKMRNAKNISQP
ncbi:MAG: formate-dependent phosphoribosylglycinamide formyltransferase [Gammaproteobacteria bacterium]|nr:formate-dependent phosphoribosylglycinamide formyltransferase [Gammaproteobacteria bacterium]